MWSDFKRRVKQKDYYESNSLFLENVLLYKTSLGGVMLTEKNYRNIYKKLQEEHPENTDAFIALQNELLEKEISTYILSFRDIIRNTTLSAETKYKLMVNGINKMIPINPHIISNKRFTNK